MSVTRVERGWPGHFICAGRCLFRRNTLLSTEDGRHYIVSTVGNHRDRDTGELETIGCDRHYETMVFKGALEGKYIDISVTDDISLGVGWAIEVNKTNRDNVDNLANDMHERNVVELQRRLELGAHPEQEKDTEAV